MIVYVVTYNDVSDSITRTNISKVFARMEDAVKYHNDGMAEEKWYGYDDAYYEIETWHVTEGRF